MRLLAIILVALPIAGGAVLTACPPNPPGPVPPSPDADGAPPVPTVVDASPAPVTSGCEAACATMTALRCRGITPSCAKTMAQLEADRLMRAPNGQPVTCACVAKATSAAGVAACGIGCWTGDASP